MRFLAANHAEGSEGGYVGAAIPVTLPAAAFFAIAVAGNLHPMLLGCGAACWAMGRTT